MLGENGSVTRRQRYLDSAEAYDLLGGVSLLRLIWLNESTEPRSKAAFDSVFCRPATPPTWFRKRVTGVPVLELAVAVGLTVGPWLLPLQH